MSRSHRAWKPTASRDKSLELSFHKTIKGSRWLKNPDANPYVIETEPVVSKEEMVSIVNRLHEESISKKVKLAHYE